MGIFFNILFFSVWINRDLWGSGSIKSWFMVARFQFLQPFPKSQTKKWKIMRGKKLSKFSFKLNWIWKFIGQMMMINNPLWKLFSRKKVLIWVVEDYARKIIIFGRNFQWKPNGNFINKLPRIQWKIIQKI